MSRIFVSYSRQSHDIANSLVVDIQDLGYVVWMDKDLSGGQAWWDQILSVIRGSDIFVFLLDADGLNSTACQREFRYAAALGKPILPVLVADGISTNLLPPELSTLQFIDYKQQDRKSAFALARALAAVPPTTTLPDPLPTPPAVPISYLGGLTQKLETTSTLTYEEQSALLVDLRRSLRDPKTSRDGRALLTKLRARRDLFATIAEDIDELLGPASPPKPPPPPPVTPAPVEPPPITPPAKLVPEETNHAPASAAPKRWVPALVGAAIGLVLGVLAFFLSGQFYRVASAPILVASVAGGVTAVITGRQRRVILAAAGGLAVGFMVWLAADTDIVWVSFFGGLGAILGAVAGAVSKKWIGAPKPPSEDMGAAADAKPNRLLRALVGAAAGSLFVSLAVLYAWVKYIEICGECPRDFYHYLWFDASWVPGSLLSTIVTLAAGAITGTITGKNWRLILIALAGLTAASGIWFMADQQLFYGPIRAAILGGGLGAVAGALVGARLKKWKRWP